MELKYICYCNKITEQEIIDTVKLNSITNINKIKKYLRKNIISDCVNRHPLKRCCSPEFKKIIKEAINMKEKSSKKKKGFFKKLFEKLDKKLEEKSKKTGCCCSSNKDDKTGGNSSCC